MSFRLKSFLCFLLLFLGFLVFKSWFCFQPVGGRDWLFFYPENLEELPFFPRLWSNQGWGGMGRVNFYHWSHFVFWWPVKFLNLLGLPWPVVEKIVFFWPYLILTAFSCWYFTNTVFASRNFLFFVLCFLFFTLNTFSLMIVGGGQMGFALGYAIMPLVLGLFIKSCQLSVVSCQLSVLTGIVLAAQVMFDPRVAYITMMAVGVYLIFRVTNFSLLNSNTLKRVSPTLISLLKCIIPALVLPFLVALGLNLFWLLPVVLVRGPVLPETYGEAGWVKFLSFARFSDALSLLHPNWPENIFGKTYFFRPEYLILPILAYISLLFIDQKTDNKKQITDNRKIIFFSLLALLGAFLAKGNNPPFGEVYLWLFEHIPGFRMFRDPVKFYTLVALGYSIILPFSLERVCCYLKTKFAN